MENQRSVAGRTKADGLRLVALGVRVLVHAVLGGAALIAIATVASVLGPTLALDLYTPPVAAWWTVFTAIAVQGVPFLLLGTVVSAAIGAFVPERVFTRLLPRNQALAVPVAGAAGIVLPGCECASVPVAGSLMRRGVAPAAALAFLLSAPAINPVVLVATSIAFPGRPSMVLGRLVASLATAVVMGWLWARFGREEWLRLPKRPTGTSARGLRATRLRVTCCAADATTSKVEVRGAADGAPPVDTWITVTGTWHPKGELGTDGAWPPVVDASAVRRVTEPADPYEKR
ncbi:permease [Streptomyces canus]|uniref:permease n=1 Tax=Streptomyces canus TaxID=58343 RepID=UPI00324FFB9F